jgi:hypothetical protein
VSVVQGRVEVFVGSMESTGREIRNQSQVSVVGVWRPVSGSMDIVGLYDFCQC